jgi:hypothetical protein
MQRAIDVVEYSKVFFFFFFFYICVLPTTTGKIKEIPRRRRRF